MSINRRNFLEASAALAAILASGPWRHVFAAAKKPDLVDVHGSDPTKMVKACLDGLGGIKKFVHKGDFVVLKPNAAFASPPDWGCTTHPQTVVAVAQACLDAGAKKVRILEFPQAKGDKCLERCGLNAAIKAVPKVKISLLQKESDFKKTKVKGGIVLKETAIAKAVLSADVLINIPAAKHHTATGVSLGLKNAMGLIWDRKSFHTMFDLHQGIADLGRVIKPQLTIIDGTRALLSNGPAGPGETSTPNRMIASADIVAADTYALAIARFGNRQMTPKDARHILLAAKAGLGQMDIKKINVKTVKV